MPQNARGAQLQVTADVRPTRVVSSEKLISIRDLLNSNILAGLRERRKDKDIF